MSKVSNIKWYSFEKSKLPSALYGYLESHESTYSFGLDHLNGDLFIGTANDSSSITKQFNPSIIVVNDFRSADSFSWLKTFAPETSPLTQFARIVSKSDLNEFYKSNFDEDLPSLEEVGKWASVVVGEILTQSEGDVDLKQIPTSRSFACFSNALARACLHYKSDLVYMTSIERLQLIESDGRFVKRNVSVFDMLPIWTLVQENLGKNPSLDEIAILLCDSALDHSRHTSEKLRIDQEVFLTDYSELFEDSIENRVLAFNKLLDRLSHIDYSSSNSIPPNVLIAAAAFLVGRGTSHAFLLKKVAKKWSSVYLWFGLMAAFGGAKSWDKDWSRLAKITERNLKSKFDWLDSPACDLCWPEYEWLSKTFSGMDVINDIPKMVSKALSVEILPGITCQLRLKDDIKSDSKDLEIRNSISAQEKNISERENKIYEREQLILTFIDKIQDLTLQSQNILRGNNRKITKSTSQTNFEFDNAKKSKIRRIKI